LELPLDKLRRPDPILFFDEVDLYEDELGDNGMSLLSIKVRVMPERMLLLSRFFLRLDDVIFRVRDTRLYIEFETGQVGLDYSVMEAPYSRLKQVPPFPLLGLGAHGRWSRIQMIMGNFYGMQIGLCLGWNLLNIALKKRSLDRLGDIHLAIGFGVIMLIYPLQ
jgi:TIP41-like family